MLTNSTPERLMVTFLFLYMCYLRMVNMDTYIYIVVIGR